MQPQRMIGYIARLGSINFSNAPWDTLSALYDAYRAMFACKDEETARKTDGFSKENCLRKAWSHFVRARFVLRQDAFKIRCHVIVELYPNECWTNYPIHWFQLRTGEASSILLCFYRSPQSKSDPKPSCAFVWVEPIKLGPAVCGRNRKGFSSPASGWWFPAAWSYRFFPYADLVCV